MVVSFKLDLGLKTFLALGDSYTFGEGVSTEEGWPAQLKELLVEDGVEMQAPDIVAQTGWTTEELLEGIEAAGIDTAFDLVSLLIGVNNQYRGQDIESYALDFERLLDLAIGFAGGDASRVVVLSIPDWSVTPFARSQADASPAAISKAIDAFNKVNCRQAYRRGCAYVDVTIITRENYADPHAWTGDNLHPAPLMYTQWARKLLPVVRPLL